MSRDAEKQAARPRAGNRAPKRGGIVAIFGKGGAGKTVLASVVTNLLTTREDSGKILVIDADPAMGLSTALGVEPGISIGQIRDEIIMTARKGRDNSGRIADMADYMLFGALVELGKFSLLAMGKSQELGCFCPVSELLRAAIEAMATNFDVVLIDGEAGLEQINRLVVRKVDTAIIITDMSPRGIQTAMMIRDMLQSLPIECGRHFIVMNRLREGSDVVEEAIRRGGLEIFACIPEDENITKLDLEGQPLINLPASAPSVLAIQRIVETVLSQATGATADDKIPQNT